MTLFFFTSSKIVKQCGDSGGGWVEVGESIGGIKADGKKP